jgi:hypothetical protein
VEDLLSLLGVDAPPPAAVLPAVVYHDREHRRRLKQGEARPCGHCTMNRARWHRDPASIPQWRTSDDIVTHFAVVIITKVDGSTLELCAQHVREYDDKRGDGNG